MIKKNYPYEASVIVMNKNRIEILKNCLESIEKYSQNVYYELIIVDALSTDGSREYLQKEWSKKASLIFEKDDTSYAASNNRAFKWSYGKYIYALNNDCEATENWLRNAIDFAEKDKQIGHVASLVLWPNGKVMSHGGNLGDGGWTEKPYQDKNRISKVANYAYAGFGLYRRDLLDELGYLPEYPVPIYFDDTTWGMEIWKAGYDVRYCPDSVIIHKLYHDENRKHHKNAAADGMKFFLAEWGEFLKENKGFHPDYPFTGVRPFKNKEIVMPVIEKAETILIFSNVEFIDGGGSKRPANLARAFLKRGYKVVFVNIYPSYESKRFKYEEVEKNLSNIEFIDINDFKVSEFFQKHSCDFVINELPHYSTLPIIKEIREKKPGIKIIIETIDNWQTSLGGSWYKPEIEKEIFQLSDKITVTARALIDIISQRADKEIVYSPNAVNTDIFDYTKKYSRPKDLPKGKPIVFYMGALWGSWIDFNLLEKCIDKYQEYNFVFVGDGMSNILKDKLSQYKNFFRLGLKPVLSMPSYIQHSNLCIVPFKFKDDTKIVETVSPLKLFEYVAMMKPVLATKYQEIENIPGCTLARTEEEFISLIPSLVNSKVNENKVKNFLKSNNWEVRADQLLHVKEEVLVSVILPTYNHAKYLRESIDSVLNQTYKNFELIIVDDGSTDNTKEILQDYLRKPRVTIITHEKNMNLPHALNTGFSKARGEFYTWTSSDNIMLPGQLEVLVHYLKVNPDKGMVYSNYQLIDSEGKPLYGGEFRKKNRSSQNSSMVSLPERITRENFYTSGDNFIGASFLYRREIAKQIGEYDINTFGAEDYDYWLRIASKFEIGYCPEVLYKYRVYSDTLNSKAKELKIYDRLQKMLKKHKNFKLSEQRIKVIFQVEKFVAGGLEKVVYSLIKSINIEVFEPIVFIEGDNPGYYGEKLLLEGYQVHCLKKSIPVLKALLEKIKPQIVNFHYSLFGIDEYRRCRVKTIYTAHNSYIWFTKSQRKYKTIVYRDYIKKVIAVSESVRDYMIIHFCIDHHKLSVIPNGLYPENYQNGKLYTREQLGFKKEDFIFINPASFTPVKCQNLIIEAFQGLKGSEIKCLMVGGIHDHTYYQQCVNKINSLGLQNNIKILQGIEPQYMTQLYKLSNCLLLPSITEGWSMVVMEAIEQGLPLILSDTGSAKEVCSENGIVIPNVKRTREIIGEELFPILNSITKRSGILTSAINQMVQGYDKFKNYADLRKVQILNRYSMKNQISQYEKEFLECAK